MDFGWSEEQLAIRAAVVDFARRALADDVHARETRGGFARELWRRCEEFGIQGRPFAEEYGGGQDILTTIVAMEALGYGCPDNGLHFGLAAQMWSVQMPIWRHGTEEQKRAYLPKLCSGEWVGAHSERFAVWYSTPSILNVLVQYGHLDRYDLGALRLVLFAGEVFPPPQFRALHRLLPHPAYHNLYRPTETNVCTAYQVPAEVPAERTDPFPIGWTCDHYRSRVVTPEGAAVAPGAKGELVIAGAGIMSGYWNLPERDAAAFLVDAEGTRWYRTGDLVVEQPDGCLVFHGRADRMVKRRGYRIELGEIEAGLARHGGVHEVAVVATTDPVAGVGITTFLSAHPGQERPSLIALKQFATEVLPRYMGPDTYRWLDAIPRTSTDKTDYKGLKRMADSPQTDAPRPPQPPPADPVPQPLGA